MNSGHHIRLKASPASAFRPSVQSTATMPPPNAQGCLRRLGEHRQSHDGLSEGVSALRRVFSIGEPSGFRSGREFAAWLGLVPRQNSTGGKHRLGGISKRGNQYLRRLLINGASANLLRSKATNADPWVIGLRRRRPPLVVAVALANKTA